VIFCQPIAHSVVPKYSFVSPVWLTLRAPLCPRGPVPAPTGASQPGCATRQESRKRLSSESQRDANCRHRPARVFRLPLSSFRFQRLNLWRKALRDQSASIRRNRTRRRRRLGTYRPGNPDERLIERRCHRPDASRYRLPSRTARHRAQINPASVVVRARPRGLSHAAQRRKASGQQQNSSHVQPFRVVLALQTTAFYHVNAMQYNAFRPAAAHGRCGLHDRAFPG